MQQPPPLPRLATTRSLSKSGRSSLSATPTCALLPPLLSAIPELTRTSPQAGYRDGITSGKSSHLQTGFDQGFTTASPFAREVGSLRGIAATLLAILTTASGAKHAGNVGGALGERNAVVVGECRALVTALGKLDEQRVLPVDQEAEEHAKSHADEGLSLEMLERKEMRRMEEAMNGLGSGKKAEGVGLEDCRGKLEDLLKACGLEGVMPRRI